MTERLQLEEAATEVVFDADAAPRGLPKAGAAVFQVQNPESLFVRTVNEDLEATTPELRGITYKLQNAEVQRVPCPWLGIQHSMQSMFESGAG